MRPTRLVCAVAACAGLVAGGCAPDDPYKHDRENPRAEVRGPTDEDRGASSSSSLRPPVDGELPGRVPPELADEPLLFPEAGETPQATLALAARLYGNWTSATAASRLARLARLSIGQARAELSQAAAQAQVDRQQRGARSRATVQAIDTQGKGARQQGLVVSKESVRAPGLPTQGWRYRVTLATLDRRPQGWVLARWEPQP